MKATALMWALALALAAFAAWVLSPVYALASDHPVADVGIYMVASVCSRDLLHCFRVPVQRFDDFGACRQGLAGLTKAATPMRPVVTGRCVSWSPPFDYRRPSK